MIGNQIKTEFFVTGQGGVPTKGVLTGTITLAGTFACGAGKVVVAGTGTAFKGLGGLQKGDYLYSTTTNEVRKVTQIIDATNIGINKAFSGVITADAVKVARRAFPRTIVLKDTGSTNASIVYGDVGSLKFENGKNESINNSPTGIPPMTYDASAASAQLTIEIYY